jgi:hypothetical protein
MNFFSELSTLFRLCMFTAGAIVLANFGLMVLDFAEVVTPKTPSTLSLT